MPSRTAALTCFKSFWFAGKTEYMLRDGVTTPPQHERVVVVYEKLLNLTAMGQGPTNSHTTHNYQKIQYALLLGQGPTYIVLAIWFF